MLKYPNMREELLEYLQVLSEADAEGLEYAVHFFFDDTPLGDDPDRAIGYFLKDLAEVEAVKRVTQTLDEVLRQGGPGRDGSVYVGLPEWQGVASAARAAQQMISRDRGLDPDDQRT